MKLFLIGMGERALKTFAQALLAAFTIGATVTSVQWPTALAVAGTATVLSVLTSLASLQINGMPAPMSWASAPPGRHEATASAARPSAPADGATTEGTH